MDFDTCCVRKINCDGIYVHDSFWGDEMLMIFLAVACTDKEDMMYKWHRMATARIHLFWTRCFRIIAILCKVITLITQALVDFPEGMVLFWL